MAEKDLRVDLTPARLVDLERRIRALEQVAIGQAPQSPRGCVCPPTSEQTCNGWNCPRREPRIGV